MAGDDRRGSWVSRSSAQVALVPALWSGRGGRLAALVRSLLGADAEALLRRLESTPQGLTEAEALRRQQKFGANRLHEERRLSRLRLLLRQLSNPLLLLLVVAAIVAATAGELTDATIVITILCASTYIGFRREYSAHAADAALRDRVKAHTITIRDDEQRPLLNEDLVPGDVVLLSAGSLVPADARVLEATDCYVSESVLTGESFPVEKTPAIVPAEAPLHERANCAYLGTNVRSGTMRCLVVRTGTATMFGAIAQRLTLRPPETEFDRGTRRFGYLLTSAMLVMVLIVFAAHMLALRPVVDTLLFAIALGLSPELLPAILSVNLAHRLQ
jgi:P-type Mg2+ transporter